MLKFVHTARMNDIKLPSIAFCGSVALLALVSATPAGAQGVPAGLLRLDPPVASDYGRRFVEVDRTPARTRHAFARDRQSRHQKLVRRPE
jgi:hypothetical protein